jgi:hypothetical protein
MGLQFLKYITDNNLLKDQEINKLKTEIMSYYATYSNLIAHMHMKMTNLKSNIEFLEDELKSALMFAHKQERELGLGDDIQYPTKKYLTTSEQIKSLVMPDVNGNIKIQVVNNRNAFPKENNTLSYMPAKQNIHKYRKHNKELTLPLSNLPYGTYFNRNGEAYVN